MLSWSDEMNHMLVALEQQTKNSLSNIKMAFKRDGLSFNAQFKQYFLQASNTRIKETYDQFEINSMLEDQVFDESLMVGSIYSPSYDRNNTQQEINGLVEIIDSSDEEGQADNQVKMELLEVLSTARYNDHGKRPEFHYDDQLDVDGSYTDEMTSMNSTGIAGQKDILKNKDVAMEAEDLHRPTNDRTSPGTSNNQLNIIDSTKGNNMAGTSTGSARKWTASSSIAKSSSNEKSKQLNMKKRFKCQHCEYSSNLKENLKLHMRTHTDLKPHRCDICPKGFTRMENLKKHKVTHTNEIPFHCRGCFIGFSQKADQDAHEKVCKSRRYECHICKKFVTIGRTLLQMHMRKHNGEKPFRCEICMKGFTQKNSLKTHLNTIHTTNNP